MLKLGEIKVIDIIDKCKEKQSLVSSNWYSPVITVFVLFPALCAISRKLHYLVVRILNLESKGRGFIHRSSSSTLWHEPGTSFHIGPMWLCSFLSFQPSHLACPTGWENISASLWLHRHWKQLLKYMIDAIK